MPDTVAALDGKTGTFDCTPASPGNHGPVRVRDIYHPTDLILSCTNYQNTI